MKKRQIKKIATKIKQGRKLTTREKREGIPKLFMMLISQNINNFKLLMVGKSPIHKNFLEGGLIAPQKPSIYPGEKVSVNMLSARNDNFKKFRESLINNISISVNIPVKILTKKYGAGNE